MPLSDHSIASIRRMLKNAQSLELSDGAVQRLKWFAYCTEHGGNVSLTCRHFGISRSTFLRWSERFDANDSRSLDPESRRPHTVRAPETDARTVAIITELRRKQPTVGKEALRQILIHTYGMTLSTSTIGRVINRHKLFFADTVSHRSKRGEADIETNTNAPATPVRPPQGQDESQAELPFLPEPGLTS